ncbi:MAG TPA: iron ABC transporter permease, partial [Dehalococcoidia bacterium]|nr:iron ABC transporter permease [Dehalococcoidia bacterium]
MKNPSISTGIAGSLDLAAARKQRQAGTRRFTAALLALGMGLALSVGLATGIGRMDIGWHTAAAVILGKLGLSTPIADRTTEVVIWGIRLSRVVLSGLVGASLAAAGVVFQGLLLNPLADPFTIGVSTGAAFGVALLVMLGVGGSFLGLSPLPLGALAGALGAMAAVMVLSRESGRIRKETLILAGIVVSTFLAALISLIKSLDEESLSAIVFWIMGSFSGRGWIHVGFLLPYLAAGLVLGAIYHRELDIMALGEEQSHHLGVAVSKVRLNLLLGASLLT